MARGGKRPNAGRKRGEPKIRVYIPVRFLSAFKDWLQSMLV